MDSSDRMSTRYKERAAIPLKTTVLQHLNAWAPITTDRRQGSPTITASSVTPTLQLQRRMVEVVGHPANRSHFDPLQRGQFLDDAERVFFKRVPSDDELRHQWTVLQQEAVALSVLGLLLVLCEGRIADTNGGEVLESNKGKRFHELAAVVADHKGAQLPEDADVKLFPCPLVERLVSDGEGFDSGVQLSLYGG